MADCVAVLGLNRQERLNALDPDLIDALRVALDECARDDSIRAAVLTGNGAAFCSGADLVSFLSQADLDPGAVGRQVGYSIDVAFNPLIRAIMAFPKPIVTAVNGMAAGGGAALALCADVVMASNSAKLKFVQVPQLGCVADLGGNWLLQRMAGRGTALAAILLGQTIIAERALQLGLFWEVTTDADLLARAVDAAGALAKAPREAVLATRRLVDMSATASLQDILDLERVYQQGLAARPDLADTVRAFLAKRQPHPEDPAIRVDSR